MLNALKPKNGTLFVVSDTHFFHNNIVKYCWRPGYNPRIGEPDQFHDFQAHNRLMERNWKRWVTDDDAVLHLGDLVQTRSSNKERLADLRLPGKKFLIIGNHDTWSLDAYAELGFEAVEPWTESYAGWNVHFDHYPAKGMGDHEISIHGHTHNNPSNTSVYHRNLSVEQTNYTPLPLLPILDNLVSWLDRFDPSWE